jgi:hypothetical protein
VLISVLIIAVLVVSILGVGVDAEVGVGVGEAVSLDLYVTVARVKFCKLVGVGVFSLMLLVVAKDSAEELLRLIINISNSKAPRTTSNIRAKPERIMARVLQEIRFILFLLVLFLRRFYTDLSLEMRKEASQ